MQHAKAAEPFNIYAPFLSTVPNIIIFLLLVDIWTFWLGAVPMYYS